MTIFLLQRTIYCGVRGKNRKSMQVIGTNVRIRYAVIEARRSDADCECFVIGYRNRESLRNVIAGSRIVATGFTSREAASDQRLQLAMSNHRSIHFSAVTLIAWLSRSYLRMMHSPVLSFLGRVFLRPPIETSSEAP